MTETFNHQIDELERRLSYRLDRQQEALDALAGRPTPDTAETSAVPEIPTSADPIISIVIPVYGAIADVLACLRSIATHPPSAAFEVIVANDASDPEEFAPVRDVVGIRIVDSDVNQGFLVTCNDAVAQARGAYVWLLNSDTEIGPQSGDALLRTFADFPDAAAAGSKLVYGDGTLQEAGGIVWNDASAWNYGRGGDPRHSEFDYARRADYVSAASLMIDRSIWNELGGFDTDYTPAYYEDTDLCLRIGLAGRSVIYQSGSVVVHHEGKSYGTDVAQEGKHHQVVNHSTFLRKWDAVIATRRANGVRPERERERSVEQRVLVIDARMLTPDMDSGSLRMQNLLVSLTDARCRCTFLPHNMAADEPYAEELRTQGVEVVGRPGARSVEQFLRRRGREFDAVIVSRLEVAEEHLTDVRRWCPDATLIYDTVDLHFLRLARAARLAGDRAAAVRADRIRDDELSAIERSDVTLVCSTSELDLVRELDPTARVEVLGNIHMPADVEELPDSDVTERSGLLFVGGFEHPPNVDAVQWFVNDVLPMIVAENPDTVLEVVGSRMIPEIERLAGPNVVIRGFVADLGPLQRSSRVSVAPLRFGAGVKGKVTQSLAVGLPVVGTSVAVEGAPVVHGEHLLIADDAADFAAAVVRLQRDDDLWRTLSRNGLDTVHVHFGPEAATSTMTDILDIGK